MERNLSAQLQRRPRPYPVEQASRLFASADARIPNAIALTACLMAAMVCRPTFAEPSGVRRATYTTDTTRAATKRRTERPDRTEPDRMPAASPSGSRPLPPRSSARNASGEKPTGREIRPAAGIATGMASLAIVLGLFLVAAWAVRRGMPAASATLPSEVVEVLGRAPLAGRQFAHLIRCGNKLLLVHLAPGCAETLTEITDPVEVDRLAGLCRQAHPQSSTASFRQVFQQFSREKK